MRLRVMTVLSLVAVLAIGAGCANLPAPPALTADQRIGIRADSEVFEAVVKSLISPRSSDDTAFRLARTLAALRVDPRFAWKASDFPVAAGGSNGADLSLLDRGPDARLVGTVEENRKRILARLGVTPGGPFSFPECPGTLVPPAPPPMLGRPAPRRVCPDEVHNYVAIGFPHRGIDPSFARFRFQKHPVIDPGRELWTVLVNQGYAGRDGQNWFQYGWVLGRNPVTRQLERVDSYLLSWVE